MTSLVAKGAPARQGLTDEHIYTEIYNAWLKDIRERHSADTQKAFRDVAERCIKDKEISLGKERIGVNMCLALSSALQRANITKLDLYHNAIRDAGCEALAHYLREDRVLTHLNLGGNDIGSVGIQAIAGVFGTHPKLQTLILGSEVEDTHLNRIDPIAARLLVEKCRGSKTLKVLDLSRNPIGHGSQEAFPAIQQLILGSSTLQQLKLADTCMNTESALLIVEALAKTTTLNTLDISSNALGASVAHEVGRVLRERSPRSATTSIKSLAFHNNPLFGSIGTQSIFQGLATDKGLIELGVSNCGVDDAAVQVLCAALATNTMIGSIEMQRNLITSHGAIELAKVLLKNRCLISLGLGQNRIEDEGTCALASAVEVNKHLEMLDLSETWTGDRGLIAMGVALANNSSLGIVRFCNNHVSDDGGTAFAALLNKNKTLQHCVLRGNSIYHSTVLRINKLLARNRTTKSEETPNKLRREVIKLHYQLYKLEEAKSQLLEQKEDRNRVEKSMEESEAAFAKAEAEHKVAQQDLLTRLQAAKSQTANYQQMLVTLTDDHKIAEQKHQVELAKAREAYDKEVELRKAAEAEKAELDAKVAEQDGMKAVRIDDLKKKIISSKDEKEKWMKQTVEYKLQVEEATKRLKELEGQAALKAAPKPKKPKADGKKAKSEKKAASDIADLLSTNTQSPPAAAA
eukprot:GILI01010024.1.p1 GENE.GILI01010024.1~~GILI01010024.1.p1  ORF type:complete len:689 (-),score=178.30 GILI01010024.1:130-2196(-)